MREKATKNLGVTHDNTNYLNASSDKRNMGIDVLRLIEFEETRRKDIFERLCERNAPIRYLEPTQFIISKEDCDYLKSVGIEYDTLADLEPKTLRVLKWHIAN